MELWIFSNENIYLYLYFCWIPIYRAFTIFNDFIFQLMKNYDEINIEEKILSIYNNIFNKIFITIYIYNNIFNKIFNKIS